MTFTTHGHAHLINRIVAALFIVGFFSALPLWGLSKQRGWVTLMGTHAGLTDSIQVTMVCRNAFSTSRETLDVVGAHVDTIPGVRRNATSRTFILVLDTKEGGHCKVMEDTAPSQSIPRTWERVKGWADVINGARDSGQASFTMEFTPDVMFWVMVAISVIFAASGALIALLGGQSRDAGEEDASAAQPH